MRSRADGSRRKKILWRSRKVSSCYELVKYVSLTGHMGAGFNLMAHLPTWKALPDDLKELIERNAVKYVRQQRQEQGNLNQSLREDFSNRGLIFNMSIRRRSAPDYPMSMASGKKASEPAAGRCWKQMSAGWAKAQIRMRAAPPFLCSARKRACRDPRRASIERLIEALVVKSAARGCELLTVAAGMGRHAVRFGGLAIAPEFDDGEMVLAVGLDHRLKTQVALILAAIIGELFGERRPVLPLGGMTSTWVTVATAALEDFAGRDATDSGKCTRSSRGAFCMVLILSRNCAVVGALPWVSALP